MYEGNKHLEGHYPEVDQATSSTAVSPIASHDNLDATLLALVGIMAWDAARAQFEVQQQAQAGGSQ